VRIFSSSWVALVESTKISQEFVGLLLQVQPRIYAYIRAQIIIRADAEDVFQETVMALWSDYDSFQPESSFLAWAYGFARNKVLHYQRRCVRQKRLFSEEAVRQIASEAEAMAEELGSVQDALRSCLTKLRPADREVVQRCYGTDMTVATVAAQLGRSVNTIKSILKRCRQSLYDCIRRTLSREEQG
jgi:RNA polymerase sigma-70 factor (ECF subfamily)